MYHLTLKGLAAHNTLFGGKGNDSRRGSLRAGQHEVFYRKNGITAPCLAANTSQLFLVEAIVVVVSCDVPPAESVLWERSYGLFVEESSLEIGSGRHRASLCWGAHQEVTMPRP